MTRNTKAIFLSHGGGPLPLLGDAGHAEMVSCLQQIAGITDPPEAIIVVSAHWEAEKPRITAGANPPLIYDYSGFPPESYEVQYPCPGSPNLAREMGELLEEAGLEAELDSSRGFDHGLFVPLKIMYPQATIPCVQLSLVRSLDPELHINLGRALRTIGQQGVLLIGSGFSFHNMREFFAKPTEKAKELNHVFEQWLLNTCRDPDLSETARGKALAKWAEAPGARFCHPREEHLLPLHVCYGLAQQACTETFQLSIMNKESSMYLW